MFTVNNVDSSFCVLILPWGCISDTLYAFSLNYVLPSQCSEPYGGEQSFVQDHHYISLVSKLLCNPLPQQEGPAGGEDHVLSPGWLLSRIWWYFGLVSFSFNLCFICFIRHLNRVTNVMGCLSLKGFCSEEKKKSAALNHYENPVRQLLS